MAEADSIACDPQKWLFAPIDAGVTLVREQQFTPLRAYSKPLAGPPLREAFYG